MNVGRNILVDNLAKVITDPTSTLSDILKESNKWQSIRRRNIKKLWAPQFPLLEGHEMKNITYIFYFVSSCPV